MNNMHEVFTACWHTFKSAYESGLTAEATAAAEDRAGEIGLTSPAAAKLSAGTMEAIRRADRSEELRTYYEDFCRCWSLLRDGQRGPIPDATWRDLMDRCYEIGARGPVARAMVVASLEAIEQMEISARAA